MTNRTAHRAEFGEPALSRADIRRLLVSLIAAEQDVLCREGRLDSGQHIHAVRQSSGDDTSDVGLGEDVLGFDSLSIASLILRVSIYFGLPETGTEDHLYVTRTLDAWTAAIARHVDIVGPRMSFTVESSGSVGTPNRTAHGIGALTTEVDALLSAPLAHDIAPARVVTCVPPHHLYGLVWGVLLPRRAGLGLLDLSASPPTRLRGVARDGDLVIATPHVLAHAGLVPGTVSRSITVVSSGAASDAATWRMCRDSGLARMIDVYGSTETGAVGWRDAHGHRMRLLPHLSRERNGVVRRRACGTPVAIPDRLRWVSDVEFETEGRKDGSVQVAGVNVSFETVTRQLRAHPAVADAVVRLVGGRLKAFVVPQEPTTDHDKLRAELRQHAARTLPAPARPDRYTFGPERPVNAMGKSADWD